MKWLTYTKLHNAVLYQAIWLIAVLGTAQLEWLLVLLLFVHLVWCDDWKTDATLMLSGATVGLSMDIVFTMLGIYQFDPSPAYLAVPFWLVALWMGFCTTLRHSLSFFTERPLLMTAFAAIGAPLSYLAAMRMGAVSFPLGTITTLSFVSVGWLFVTPVLLFLHSSIAGTRPKHALS